MRSARLILESTPTPGAWNMAVDETLLESALASGAATVRLYQWSAPTVSLGYFQDAGEFERDPQWSGLAAVRRLSGGGAILHDREITYSISLPPSHPLVAHPSRLYAIVHTALMGVLARHGVMARMRAMPSMVHGPWSIESNAGTGRETVDHGQRTMDPSPFLCFGRGDPNDIVLGAHKIVGSAQRRRRGAILQHGSVLLERSPHAPDFPGIADLTGIRLDRADLSQQIGAAVAAALGESPVTGELSPEERLRAHALECDRYTTVRVQRSICQ